MKPIYLDIEAFGAFHKKQTIDFEQLNKYGLFLIHGATGAGKTTIFDAICLAMFGKTTSERAPESMRSQFAESSQDSKIVFIFKVKQHYYRAERRFSMNRKGDDINKKSYFSAVSADDFNTPLDTPLVKEGEINEKVSKIVGFSVEQFKQIVVLPQGRFSEFLKAKTDEKQQILTKIFGTKIYEEIVLKLTDKAKKYRENIKELGIQLQTLSGTEIEENYGDKIEILAQKISELKSNNDFLESAQKQSNNSLQKAKQVADFFKEFENISSKYSNYQQEQLKQVARQLQLDKANQAAILKPDFEIELQLEKDQNTLIQQATTRREQFSQQAKTLSEKEILFNDSVEAYNEKIERFRKRLNDLNNALPLFESIEISEKEQNELVKEVTFTQQQLTQQIAQIADTETTLFNHKKEITTQLEPQTKNVVIFEQRLKELEKLAILFNDRKKADEAFKKHQKEQEKALFSFNESKEKRIKVATDFNETESRWIQGQAARLSVSLKENEPCPVCGSTHHPQKALADANLISDEELKSKKKAKEAAEIAHEQNEKVYTETRIATQTAEATLQELVKQLGSHAERSHTDFLTEQKTVNQQFSEAKTAQSRLDFLQKEITNLEELLKSLQQYKEITQDKLTKAQTKLEAFVQIIAEKRNLLPDKINSKAETISSITKGETLLAQEEVNRKAQQDEIQAVRLALGKLETSIQNTESQITTIKSTLSAQIEKNIAACFAQGFENKEAATQAFLPEEERKQLQKNIAEWQEQYTRLATENERLQQAIQGKEKPDLQAFELAEKAASEAYKQHLQTLATIEKEYKTATELAQRIAQKQQELDAKTTEAKPYFELADLASGKNAKKMQLTTYILTTLLDEVLIYTNQRLQTMSSGRYAIGRVEYIDEVKGSGQKGLELEVTDAYVGQKRGIHSLSGGETFFTALALALGLADVAASRQGGLRVEALFIDEGFGTLDNETLDKAIGVLTDLESEHRTVGIISHVAELRERIPARLEVLKGNNGSTLQVHLPLH